MIYPGENLNLFSQSYHKISHYKIEPWTKLKSFSHFDFMRLHKIKMTKMGLLTKNEISKIEILTKKKFMEIAIKLNIKSALQINILYRSKLYYFKMYDFVLLLRNKIKYFSFLNRRFIFPISCIY